MKLISIIDEDFVNYKEPCMTIECPYCSFKCDRENGTNLCHNGALISAPRLAINNEAIVRRYLANTITSAICFQGLEPFDSLDLFDCLMEFRARTNDTIVIYTGYTEEEVQEQYKWIYDIPNVIIKFGRFRPNQTAHFDEVLGVNLISDNQYAKKIS